MVSGALFCGGGLTVTQLLEEYDIETAVGSRQDLCAKLFAGSG